MTGLGARFDWYELTVDGHDDGREVLRLALRLGAVSTPGRGRNGYASCVNLERGDDVLAKVYGRSARPGEVHIVTTSEACDEVVPVLREFWPEHRVSRADSSVDFTADFDELDRAALAFAEARGISYRLVTNSEGGATRYLGSMASEVAVRVYKKSEQLRALHPERADEVPDGVVRFELQVRPGKREVKQAAAVATADELWGFAQWSQLFAAQFLDIEAPRVSTHFRRPSDWARALHYLGQQYGPMTARRAEQVGLDETRRQVLEALGLS
jgi:DNA relaxase NicK